MFKLFDDVLTLILVAIISLVALVLCATFIAITPNWILWTLLAFVFLVVIGWLLEQPKIASWLRLNKKKPLK